MSEVPPFFHAYARPAAPADAFITITRGEGAIVYDADGKRYIDALASLWYCNVGHGRTEIIDAITAQLRTLDAFHTFDRFTNPPAEALTERVAALAPMPDARVFLTTGGSEAVETALKLARLAHFCAGAPERTLVISRVPSYHGVSYGAMSATGLPPNLEGFGPLVPDIVQVPKDDLDAMDAVLAERGDQLAAIIAEPVVGAGGVYPPAPGYLQELRERCDRYGGLLILDEVICGFGRLGTWWGAQRYGVTPDLVTFAKAVTSGYQPVGGVVVGGRVREALEADADFVFRHGHTYGGHPTACAAGPPNLDIIENEGLLARASAVGARLGTGLRGLVDGDAVIEARGDGAVWAAGLGEGVGAMKVRDELLALGVIARPIGTSTIAFCPPLVIEDADVDTCVEALAKAVRAAR